MTDRTTLLILFPVLLAFAACDDGNADEADGGDTDTDTDTDTEDTEPDGLFVEEYEPDDGAVVEVNQKVHIRFSAAGDVDDHMDAETVVVLIDGEPVRAWPYFSDAAANHEFRFVPFPVWVPGDHHVVTVLAGAALAGAPDIALEEDFTFEFTVSDAPFDEDYDPETTPELTSAEMEAMEAGGDLFTDSDVVGDWDESDSSLHDISIPVQPDDPDVAAFGQKMVDSLAPLYAVGLAAPQVAVGRRVFAADVNGEQRVFVNPEIEDWSEDDLYTGFAEGCLSIEGESAIVSRPAWISVEFDTPDGEHVDGYELEDFDAKVFLHEYDHLNGILMTDREERRSW